MENTSKATLVDTLSTSNVTVLETLSDVTGQSERTVGFTGLMVVMYLITIILGTLALQCIKGKTADPEAPSAPLRDGGSPAGKTGPDPDGASPAAKAEPDPEALGVTNDVKLAPKGATKSQRSLPWVKHRSWYAKVVFWCTYVICLVAGFVSMATGHLDNDQGFSWEGYTSLFGLGCLWEIAQAIMAAQRRPAGKRYELTAFAIATTSGIFPFLSDSFDCMKDVLFGMLALMEPNGLVKALGVLTLLWLPVFHIILFTDERCLLEFAANHLSVLELPLADARPPSEPAQGSKDSWMVKTAKSAQSTALPVIYKQLTPTKRKMLLWENVPQAVLAVIYLALVGGSPVVAVLNLGVPVFQIVVTFVLFKPVQRRVAPKIASQIDTALEKQDLSLLLRLRHEALDDAEVFHLVCLKSRILKVFTEDPRRESAPRRSVVLQAAARSLKVWQRCLDGLVSGEKLDLNEVLEGNETDFKGALAIIAFDMVTKITMRQNQLPGSWAKDLVTAMSETENVELLDLGHNALGDEGAEAIAGVLETSSTLQWLFLHRNHIGPRGAEAIGDALKTNSSLQRLYIHGNRIGLRGAQALRDALKTNSTLQRLELYGNRIGPSGAEAIADALKTNSTLQRLCLDFNQIGPHGAEALAAALLRNLGLTWLRMSQKDVGEAGQKALEDAEKVKKMTKETFNIEWTE